ncbi:hypothetical protein ACFE04_017205 [Oxalis oulophora]
MKHECMTDQKELSMSLSPLRDRPYAVQMKKDLRVEICVGVCRTVVGPARNTFNKDHELRHTLLFHMLVRVFRVVKLLPPSNLKLWLLPISVLTDFRGPVTTSPFDPPLVVYILNNSYCSNKMNALDNHLPGPSDTQVHNADAGAGVGPVANSGPTFNVSNLNPETNRARVFIKRYLYGRILHQLTGAFNNEAALNNVATLMAVKVSVDMEECLFKISFTDSYMNLQNLEQRMAEVGRRREEQRLAQQHASSSRAQRNPTGQLPDQGGPPPPQNGTAANQRGSPSPQNGPSAVYKGSDQRASSSTFQGNQTGQISNRSPTQPQNGPSAVQMQNSGAGGALPNRNERSLWLLNLDDNAGVVPFGNAIARVLFVENEVTHARLFIRDHIYWTTLESHPTPEDYAAKRMAMDYATHMEDGLFKLALEVKLKYTILQTVHSRIDRLLRDGQLRLPFEPFQRQPLNLAQRRVRAREHANDED